MTDVPAAVRNWGALDKDEQALIKLFYINGVQSLAQIARAWGVDFQGLKQACYHKEWKKEKDGIQVSIGHGIAQHLKITQQVLGMMENIQQGYEDLMQRHQYHDTFELFPFDSYYKFLEMYAKSVNLLGGVKSVSSDVNLTLQQNTNVQQNNFALGSNGENHDEETVQITDQNAKQTIRKLMEAIVVKARPPKPKEIQAQIIGPDSQPDPNGPDPAQGKFR
jgi:hypothetical protein